MNTPNKKVGRPRAYTPEALEAKFEEYVEWVKANPRYSNKASAGEIIAVPTQRPLTLVDSANLQRSAKTHSTDTKMSFATSLRTCEWLLRRTSWRAHYVGSTIQESLPVSFILPTVRM